MRDVVALLMIGFVAFGALLAVANVGKPRQPITGGLAVAVVIVQGLFIAGVAYVAGL